jgi:hypothetical protein
MEQETIPADVPRGFLLLIALGAGVALGLVVLLLNSPAAGASAPAPIRALASAATREPIAGSPVSADAARSGLPAPLLPGGVTAPTTAGAGTAGVPRGAPMAAGSPVAAAVSPAADALTPVSSFAGSLLNAATSGVSQVGSQTRLGARALLNAGLTLEASAAGTIFATAPADWALPFPSTSRLPSTTPQPVTPQPITVQRSVALLPPQPRHAGGHLSADSAAGGGAPAGRQWPAEPRHAPPAPSLPDIFPTATSAVPPGGGAHGSPLESLPPMTPVLAALIAGIWARERRRRAGARLLLGIFAPG